MPKPMIDEDFVPDYPPEICERRTKEVMRRMMRMPATYNLEDDEKDPAVIAWRKMHGKEP